MIWVDSVGEPLSLGTKEHRARALMLTWVDSGREPPSLGFMGMRCVWDKFPEGMR